MVSFTTPMCVCVYTTSDMCVLVVLFILLLSPTHHLFYEIGNYYNIKLFKCQSVEALAPHLARLACVRAPKSTGHSLPGGNSIAPCGKAKFTPA